MNRTALTHQQHVEVTACKIAADKFRAAYNAATEDSTDHKYGFAYHMLPVGSEVEVVVTRSSWETAAPYRLIRKYTATVERVYKDGSMKIGGARVYVRVDTVRNYITFNVRGRKYSHSTNHIVNVTAPRMVAATEPTAPAAPLTTQLTLF